MPYARFEKPAQDADGNLLTNIWCEVRREDVAGNPLEPLFSDRLGASPLDNPFLAAGGVPAFHAAGGAFQVRYYKTGYDETFRYVGVGLGAENDLQGFVPMGAWDAVTTYTIGDLVSRVISGVAYLFASRINDNLNNATPSSATDNAYWMWIPTFGAEPGYSTVATDADFGLTPGAAETLCRHTGTLTTARAVTLNTTNALPGRTKVRITRTGGGAFNLNVGTGPLKAMASNTWADFVYDGSAFYLAAYGAL